MEEFGRLRRRMNREVSMNMLLEDGIIKPGDGVLCLDIQVSSVLLLSRVLESFTTTALRRHFTSPISKFLDVFCVYIHVRVSSVSYNSTTFRERHTRVTSWKTVMCAGTKRSSPAR